MVPRRSLPSRWEGAARGPFRLSTVCLLAMILPLNGCNYGFSQGTGVLQGARTVAIEPFENETTRLELATELFDEMTRELPSQLGLVIAGAQEADILVRGVIRGYELDTPNFRAGATTGARPEVLQRQVTVRAAVQIIDQNRNLILWEDTGVQVQGQYLEASETEEIGKREALDLLVKEIVDGAQSNW